MIEVSHLTKKYGDYLAVDDLTFSIEKGQIYGFLGPNGAGKSTTMNIMTGCLSATSGDIKIGGFDIFEEADKAKKLIGYLPELPPLYLDRTPKEYLNFVAAAKKIPSAQRKSQIESVMTVTGIVPVADRLMKNLSKGYKQRVGIAQALLGDPEVIILDEPTVGLDPIQIIEIRDLIRKLGEKHTIILSSHILSEVQAVCDTVLIISKGKLVACDTPDRLEELFAGKTTLVLTVPATNEQVKDVLSKQSVISKATLKRNKDDDCLITVESDSDGKTVAKSMFFAFADAGIPIYSMIAQKASLEDIFIELTSSDSVLPENPPDEPENNPTEDLTETESSEQNEENGGDEA